MNLTRPYQALLYSTGAITATTTSSTITLPLCSSYMFVLTATIGGTSPTVDVAIQDTYDDGTTFFSVLRFAQMTATGTRMLRVNGSMGVAEAGTEGASADTGGALNNNVILTDKIKIKFTIGGTSPTCTGSVYLIATPRGSLVQM